MLKDQFGLTSETDALRIEMKITGDYTIPLIIKDLVFNFELKGSEEETHIDDFELRYSSFYIDSNFIISTISSYVFSESILKNLILQARKEIRHYIYKAL